jgi:hypothetical protein
MPLESSRKQFQKVSMTTIVTWLSRVPLESYTAAGDLGPLHCSSSILPWDLVFVSSSSVVAFLVLKGHHDPDGRGGSNNEFCFEWQQSCYDDDDKTVSNQKWSEKIGNKNEIEFLSISSGNRR